MSIAYFKKFSPTTPVILPGNVRVDFTSLNSVIGYYATDQEDAIAFLKRCIEEQRYGLSEISETEFFTDYVEKKKQGAKPLVALKREQIGGNGYEPGNNPVSDESVRLALSVEKTDVPTACREGCGLTMDDRPVGSVAPNKPKAPEPKKPNVGQRKKTAA